MMKHKGSCLCGGVQYEIHGELRDVLNCHCSMCRKLHASAFRTRATINAGDWKIIEGDELIKFSNHRQASIKGSVPTAAPPFTPVLIQNLDYTVFLWERWTPIPV